MIKIGIDSKYYGFYRVFKYEIRCIRLRLNVLFAPTLQVQAGMAR